MVALIAVTFSALKGTAIIVAAVNAAVLAVVLFCMLLLYRTKDAAGGEKKAVGSFLAPAPKPIRETDNATAVPDLSGMRLPRANGKTLRELRLTEVELPSLSERGLGSYLQSADGDDHERRLIEVRRQKDQ